MLKYYFHRLYKVFQLKIITSFFFFFKFYLEDGKYRGILMHFEKDEKIERRDVFYMEDRITNCRECHL